jgi:hypothetical protein
MPSLRLFVTPPFTYSTSYRSRPHNLCCWKRRYTKADQFYVNDMLVTLVTLYCDCLIIYVTTFCQSSFFFFEVLMVPVSKFFESNVKEGVWVLGHCVEESKHPNTPPPPFLNSFSVHLISVRSLLPLSSKLEYGQFTDLAVTSRCKKQNRVSERTWFQEFLTLPLFLSLSVTVSR